MPRLHFAPLDIALVGAYFGTVLIVGFWRRRLGIQAYLIADRSLPVYVFVATLVATFYGGILAVGEFTYGYGLANWTTQGLPYYVFATVFALILARKIRVASLYTIPDKLAETYGRPAALLGALFAFVMVTPAPYILMVGKLTSIVFGVPLLPAMILGTILSVAYVWVGGFQSDVRINVLQFVLMFAGFGAALAVVAARAGGYGWLVRHLPPDHLKLDGGQGFPYVAVWFFIALWTFVDPGFHQRCYAARTPDVARLGILIAVPCWMLFDFLTTSTGLYARAIVPGIPVGSQDLAYPILAERMLPAGIKGLFYIGMMAAIMSSVVSYTFIASMTIGRDLIWRLRRDIDVDRVPDYTRIGLFVTTSLAIGICVLIGSAVKQWLAIGSVVVPGLLLPVLSCYWPRLRLPRGAVLASMVLGAGLSLACLTIGWHRYGVYADTSSFPFHTQPMYPGLAASVLACAAGWLVLALRKQARWASTAAEPGPFTSEDSPRDGGNRMA